MQFKAMFWRNKQRPEISIVDAGTDNVATVETSQAITKATDPETDHYLTGSRLYLVIAGIGLAIYLFALDISVVATVRLLPASSCLEATPPLSVIAGHPLHNSTIQLYDRYWLVWRCVSSVHVFVTAHGWKTVYKLFAEMDIFCLHWHLSFRLCSLWGSLQFSCKRRHHLQHGVPKGSIGPRV